MYEVWFVDYEDNHYLEATFTFLEDAEAYIDDWDRYLAYDEMMYIKEKE